MVYPNDSLSPKPTHLALERWVKKYAARRVVNGTKANARKVRDQMRREREGGLVLNGSKLMFEDFAGEYLRIAETSNEISFETLKNHAYEADRRPLRQEEDPYR